MINLVNMIDNYMVESNVQRKTTSHHPSGITSCIRQQWYNWKEAPVTNPIDGNDIFKMQIGNVIHDLITNTLEKSGLDIIPEIEFKKTLDGCDHPISGRVDNLFMDKDLNVLCGIEVKTSFGKGIVAIQQAGKPKEEHLYQVLTYLYCTDVEQFYLLYVARDSSYKTQFHFEKKNDYVLMNGNMIMSLEAIGLYLRDRIITIEGYVNNNILPEKPYHIAIKEGQVSSLFQRNKNKYKSSWQCEYCKYLNYCWSKELTEFATSDNYEEHIRWCETMKGNENE